MEDFSDNGLQAEQTGQSAEAPEVIPNKPKRISRWSYEAHLVKCDNCGKDALDHMTECPFCHAPLTQGYRPMSESTMKAVKIIALIAGVVIVLLILIPLLKERFGN